MHAVGHLVAGYGRGGGVGYGRGGGVGYPVWRKAVSLLCAAACVVIATGCGGSPDAAGPFGAQAARVGDSMAILGWNLSVADVRFESGLVLVDVDAAPTDPAGPRARPGDVRFGLYGALAHPIEATGIGSCESIADTTPGALAGVVATPLSAPTPERLTGTVCLGPLSDQAQVRGVYVYSAADRIAGTVVAYPAAFPVGLPPTNPADTGLTVQTTSVEAWRADGAPVTPEALGDPGAFHGKGYMLLGLQATGSAGDYRDASARRGGPLMLLVAPSLPSPGLNPACAAYGASVLIMPTATLDAVAVEASLCTQGEINAAVLYPTVSVVGTHAAVWTLRADT